jgi:hypothetical protein
MPLLELTDTGGQNAQQLVFALAVLWQMMCWRPRKNVRVDLAHRRYW